MSIRHVTIAAVVSSLAVLACQSGEQAQQGSSSTSAAEAAGPQVVEVTARDFAFEAPDSIPAGWTTFRMANEGQQTHFLYLGRLPDGKTFADYMDEVLPPFDSVYHLYREGELSKPETMKAFGEAIPEWFASREVKGGPGFVAPGGTSQATVRLEPGEYWMECYVKNEDGTFHTSLGMVRGLTVTADSISTSPPEADLTMTLSNGEIATTDTLSPGENTVEVHFREHPQGTLFLNNDVHLIRWDENTDRKTVARWMDAWKSEGLRAPAPAEFLGGIQEGAAGDTAYFTVDVQPGSYAWVMEMPVERSLIQEFTIQ